ncbi:Reducing polyketide synthase FUB1 [Colletotrichum spinosum]|uniref:Reducing polyketide synthase FUB1 n=1 Tax=Colletotrichum spinosum TaxID=1347390 RepID=A0A4R8Q051_9PEZI|nr:Reducing polyketide synthase FUB1 [Colletotrichum spinosum]
MSLVCGSNTYLTPECMSFPLSNASFLCPDARSYSFDHKANGYARGEGYVFVLGKPLAAALRDGDTIRAVIRTTGVNQDGRTPSITQPSANAQVELIKNEYVEAHGTGTPVGDPIEATAIGQVFRPHRTRRLWIGSVKSNIGHLEVASGLAGLLKTVLSLEKGFIPPIADFQKENPAIDTDELGNGPKTNRARVNVLQANGKSHANGHANGLDNNGVHSNGEMNDDHGPHATYAVLAFSAAGEDGVQRQTSALEDYFATHSRSDISAQHILNYLANTLGRRSLICWRGFAVVNSLEDVKGRLCKSLSPVICASPSKTPELSFVFTCRGAQYARMGINLIQYPVFQESLVECEKYIRDLDRDWSLFAELRKPQEESSIDMPSMSQPLCTALQVAIVDLFRS